MRGDNDSRDDERVEHDWPADASESEEAARAAFRDEISDAISGIIDRDHFLQRLARRVSDVTGVLRVAIYTRAGAGRDLVLRSSTFPTMERVAPRIPMVERVVLGQAPLAGQEPQYTLTVPIPDSGDPMGALVLYGPPGMPFADATQEVAAGIAVEIAPAINVSEHHHAVKQTSVIDLTTGAYNLWYLNQRFEEEIARSQRTRNPVTIALVHILGFEDVQYSLGYERADQVLRDMANELMGLIRVFDIVGMRSRSSFGVLLPDTDIAAAATVIARIHQRSAKVLDRVNEEMGHPTVQVVTGAASFPADGDRVSSVKLVAEQRLLQNESLHRRIAESA